MRTRIAAALFAGALSLQPALASAQEAEGEASIEEIAVASAHTPAEHAALARHYRDQAVQARIERSRHERMGRAYGRGKFSQRERMNRHCLDLSRKYAEMAEDYEALAKLHEDEARRSE